MMRFVADVAPFDKDVIMIVPHGDEWVCGFPVGDDGLPARGFSENSPRPQRLIDIKRIVDAEMKAREVAKAGYKGFYDTDQPIQF